MLNKITTLKEEHEDGFTLIELLVVILIIGILAAIAIPVFLNQRQTANDGAVQSDVKNAATQIETGIIDNPSATIISSTQPTPGSDLRICIGASTCTATTAGAIVSKTSEGVAIAVTGNPNTSYTIRAWHTNGKSYNSSTNAAVYNSASGGLTN